MSYFANALACLFIFVATLCAQHGPEPATAQRVTQPDRSAWHEVQWSAFLADECGGEAEHRLPDGSRVDILTEGVAWEVEWAPKWPESIGQSVFYGMATDREPGVWLLLRPGDDEDYLRCLMVCRRLGIRLRVQFVR